MKQFAGMRSLKEIRKLCKARGWTLNTRLYDTQGHDHVKIEWRHRGVSGECLLNTFNGRFFGFTKRNIHFTSSDTEHEQKPWFNALLNLAYHNRKPEPKTV